MRFIQAIVYGTARENERAASKFVTFCVHEHGATINGNNVKNMA